MLDFLLKGSQADFPEVRRADHRARRRALVSALRGPAGQRRAGNCSRLISRVPRPLRAHRVAGHSPGQAPGRGAVDSTAVVLGRLYPRGRPRGGPRAFRRLAEVLPGTVALRSPLPAPSAVYATLLHRLIVLDDLPINTEAGPYGWSPLPLDRGKPGSTLADWISLPWGGPDQIILPGYHTVAEDSLGA